MSPGWAAVVTSTDKSMPAAPADSEGRGCSDADAPQLSPMLGMLHYPTAGARTWASEADKVRSSPHANRILANALSEISRELRLFLGRAWRTHGSRRASTMYWSGGAIGETLAESPAPSSSAMTISGATRILPGGPRRAAGLKSTTSSLPPVSYTHLTLPTSDLV